MVCYVKLGIPFFRLWCQTHITCTNAPCENINLYDVRLCVIENLLGQQNIGNNLLIEHLPTDYLPSYWSNYVKSNAKRIMSKRIWFMFRMFQSQSYEVTEPRTNIFILELLHFLKILVPTILWIFLSANINFNIFFNTYLL